MSNSPKNVIIFGFAISAIVCVSVIVLSMSSADCGWHGVAITYMDVNENNHFDGDDSILPGVPVHVDDIHNHYTDVAYHAVTDQNGITHLDVFIAGCPTVDFEVYANTPAGYKLTTAARLHVKKDFFGSLDTDTTYYFGFAALKQKPKP